MIFTVVADRTKQVGFVYTINKQIIRGAIVAFTRTGALYTTNKI